MAHPRPPADARDFERAPALWVLGSSDYGARLAAHFGLPYAFAYFFMDGQGVEQALSLYRALYQPSERHPTPQATICVWALAADSEAEARHHALSRDRWRIDRARGRLGPLLSPDAVAERGFSAEEGPALEAQQRKAFVGSAPQVAAQLRELATALGLDELVVNTWAHDPAVRRRSYALLAREFGLAPDLATTPPENAA
ncbi:luciferase family oxidoreductase, group 1 [Methylibium sp. T29]|nr:luciferase family oxidoreductase, group 1 [Methylibium sp. T29]